MERVDGSGPASPPPANLSGSILVFLDLEPARPGGQAGLGLRPRARRQPPGQTDRRILAMLRWQGLTASS